MKLCTFSMNKIVPEYECHARTRTFRAWARNFVIEHELLLFEQKKITFDPLWSTILTVEHVLSILCLIRPIKETHNYRYNVLCCRYPIQE